MAELTPMMKQYLEIKKDNPDSILFFRLGDFYEMFADEPACPKDTSGTTLALPVLNGIGESCTTSFTGNT